MRKNNASPEKVIIDWLKTYDEKKACAIFAGVTKHDQERASIRCSVLGSISMADVMTMFIAIAHSFVNAVPEFAADKEGTIREIFDYCCKAVNDDNVLRFIMESLCSGEEA